MLNEARQAHDALTNESEAIRHIYDAATDASRWPEVLDRLCSSIGAAGGLLAVRDLTADTGAIDPPYAPNAVSRLFRDKAAELDAYFAKFGELEINEVGGLMSHAVGEVLTDDLLYPDIDALQDRDDFVFRRDHLGIYRRVAARFDDNSRWLSFTFFQLAKEHERIPESLLTSLKRFLPHIGKSVELGRTFSQLQNRFGAVLGVLDRVGVGLCLLDSAGTVIHLNQEARTILEHHRDVRLHPQRRIQFSHRDVDAAMRKAVRDVAGAAMGHSNLVELRTTSEGAAASPGLLLEVAPARDALAELDDRLPNGGYALVTLIDPDRQINVSSTRLSLAYGLSLSEADVCRLLVAGHTRAEIAEIRRVSLETIRTQAKSIARKTGTNSRFELLSLALRTSPPIIGD